MIILYFHDDGVFRVDGAVAEVDADRLFLIVTVAGGRVTSEVVVVVVASFAADDVDTVKVNGGDAVVTMDGCWRAGGVGVG